MKLITEDTENSNFDKTPGINLTLSFTWKYLIHSETGKIKKKEYFGLNNKNKIKDHSKITCAVSVYMIASSRSLELYNIIHKVCE